jgi:FMN-dependent NADH-azoreductase
MKNALLVISSPRGDASQSTKIAHAVVDRLMAKNPEATVKIRNLAREPLPHIDENFVWGMMIPPASRTAVQAAAIERSDALIKEVFAADVIVIASAMINFGLSSTLKSWFDHIIRAGVTFKYTAGGVEGLVFGKKIYLIAARGSIYSEGPMRGHDFQEPYLKAVLAFMGMTDVEVITMEGLSFGAQAVAKALAAALDKISTFDLA